MRAVGDEAGALAQGQWRSDAPVREKATSDSLARADDIPNDRDLGRGAGGERLGGLNRVGERDREAGGEGYATIWDNRFVRTADQGGDASTFSVDVDTASYSNVRRFITQERRLPPPDAVRIEELINAVPYAYAPPSGDDEHPFRFHAAMAACPWREDHRLVRIAIKGREIPRAQRPPANLVFLVDVSGSMSDENKLPLVKRALNELTEQLDERDTVTLVTYAGSDRVALEPTRGDRQRTIRSAIRGLDAGGSTHGSAGIRRAYEEARHSARPGVASRVILCTDGDFNVGVTSPDELRRLIADEARGGTFLNVYGFGMGNLQDATMEALADRGNGVYAYIDSAQQAHRVVCEDLLGQLVTIAKDVKIQVFFNPAAVSAWRLIGYENRVLAREDFNDDRVDAGDIGAGHTVTALYEIVPVGEVGRRAVDPNPFVAGDRGDDRAPLDDTPAPGGDTRYALRLRLRYKQPDGQTSRLLEADVPNAVSGMDADFRTAAAIAAFGMQLRSSPYRGESSWSLARELARAGRGDDPAGRRRELLELIDQAQALDRR